MTTATLLILPDGTVHGLYTEAIDLAALGTLNIERASTIEFDNRSQLWRVCHQDGHRLYSSASRIDCQRWEQEFFTSEVLLKHTPASD
jgi:hypothetical protein